MGKKYLETKNNSLESSVLGVWKTAIEEGDVREASVMDGRTKAYKSHRAKLEAARTRREETPEAKKRRLAYVDKSGDRAVAGAKRRDKITKALKGKKFDPSVYEKNEEVDLDEGYFGDTLYEWVFDLDDQAFDDILESMSDEEIIAFDEGIGGWLAKKAVGAIKKRLPGTQARATHLKKNILRIRCMNGFLI